MDFHEDSQKMKNSSTSLYNNKDTRKSKINKLFLKTFYKKIIGKGIKICLQLLWLVAVAKYLNYIIVLCLC